MFENIIQKCQSAKDAAFTMAALSTAQKNTMLEIIAAALIDSTDKILKANAEDIALAKGKPTGFIDRLTLTAKRIGDMAAGVRAVIGLPDPVGITLDKFTVQSGLKIEKRSVPLGVIGIIYEARPNVTADCIALCLKSGNCAVLRGSRDAYKSNLAIVAAVKGALTAASYDADFIQLIDDVTRGGADFFMTQNKYLDAMIPRGGAALIQNVVQNSTVPVIETGAGVCHVFVEKTADLKTAEAVLINAKCSRPSVCNSAETLLLDAGAPKETFATLIGSLIHSNVAIHACPETLSRAAACPLSDRERGLITAAAESDFETEYNDFIINVKIVKDTADAIRHINRHGTHHSDAIITADDRAAELFLNGVDSAAVYVNASTRFTDGGEFGFGAEIGISTQKLHARGPVGLRELTSYKYRIVGTGQVR
ncbi:gamma-glutamyl phosphate reductase [Clostridia bacterium]|nr:gamma-glutamyl phosphate reductase [Clostridia bacterium]